MLLSLLISVRLAALAEKKFLAGEQAVRCG
jgi:hypothetical protein